MILILGTIIGLLISLIVIAITLWQKPKLERTWNQARSGLAEKGKIIEPIDNGLEEFLNEINEASK